MEMVVLKNGATEALSLVSVTMMSINQLLASKPLAFYEMVEVCRDKNHKIFGTLGNDLVELALLQLDGQPHGSIKNIVLSAVEGEGLDMTVSNPTKPINPE